MSFVIRRELFKDAYDKYRSECNLFLRFIGTDGSMGLRHGNVYTCRIHSDGHYINVDWANDYGGISSCPYSSIEALNDNWRSV